MSRRVAVLGCTGHIGQNALEVIAESGGQLVPALLSVHNNTALLVEQVRRMTMRNIAAGIKGSTHVDELPRWVVVTGETADRQVLKDLPEKIEIRFGQQALCELVQHTDIDIVLSAIVGSAGLTSSLAVVQAGKPFALANKESLVMGGQLLTDLAKRTGTAIIPVDSEHSAVMQALGGRIDSSVEKIILTASGGPFREWTLKDLEHVNISDALKHPVWKMGKKITIDSATLMNKALEIIEARWLFDVPAAKIGVVIHPQSIVHSMVEYVDGAVMAQLSQPDMRLPIQLALNYPQRLPGPALKMNWQQKFRLDFEPPDYERFPAIPLGLEVAEKGGSAGAVLNAANETAVSAFLEGRLPFHRIVGVCRSVLAQHHFEPHPTLEQLFALDAWTRKETLSAL